MTGIASKKNLSQGNPSGPGWQFQLQLCDWGFQPSTRLCPRLRKRKPFCWSPKYFETPTLAGLSQLVVVLCILPSTPILRNYLCFTWGSSHPLGLVTQYCCFCLLVRFHPVLLNPCVCIVCRDNAFRLKPLQMSDELIKQLNAVEVKLHAAASKLQELVNQGKNKAKHYAPIVEQATNSLSGPYQFNQPV